MSAELNILSAYGNGSNVSAPPTAQPILQIYLTDLPTPTAYEIHSGGQVVQSGKWNSGIGYEYNIPLTGLTEGTYKFTAVVYFTSQNPVTTNSATLTIQPNATGFTATQNVNASLSNLTTLQKAGITAGVFSAFGLAGFLLYAHHTGKQSGMHLGYGIEKLLRGNK